MVNQITRSRRSLTFVFLPAIFISAISEVRPPKLISDGMALPRDTEWKVGGRVSPFRTDNF